MSWILLYQSEAEKINNAIKSIIQMHLHHKWPKMAIIVLVIFPMIFLCISNDFTSVHPRNRINYRPMILATFRPMIELVDNKITRKYGMHIFVFPYHVICLST